MRSLLLVSLSTSQIGGVLDAISAITSIQVNTAFMAKYQDNTKLYLVKPNTVSELLRIYSFKLASEIVPGQEAVINMHKYFRMISYGGNLMQHLKEENTQENISLLTILTTVSSIERLNNIKPMELIVNTSYNVNAPLKISMVVVDALLYGDRPDSFNSNPLYLAAKV